MTERKPLDANAMALMVLLAALWGLQQVSVKWIVADVSLLMQGALRSAIAAACLVAWAAAQRVPLLERDGTLAPGLFAGALFALEFVLIYGGLGYTDASRIVVFIYLTPALTALGLHFFVPSERLRPLQWIGVILAFAGIALAFSEGFLKGKSTWIGDLCGAGAACLWAATTIVIRTTKLAAAPPAKTLLYQLGVCAAVMLVASPIAGEPGIVALTPKAIASLAYQSVIIAFASFLAWFWLLQRYLAARLSVMTFLTPMFGVLFGVWLLAEPLSGHFLAAAVLVAAGIVLVNLKR